MQKGAQMTNVSATSILATKISARSMKQIFERGVRFAALAAALGAGVFCTAQARPAANPAPDTLVLSNGDTLHGKFVNEIAGKVTFHCEPLGDVSVTWDKIKELHTGQQFAVLDKNVKKRGKKAQLQIPEGAIDANTEAVTLQPQSGPALAPIPLKNAQFIMDAATLNKQINHEPGFFTGWNGAATAGAAVVASAENQYTVSGAISLVRVVPTVSWLDPRNRTSTDFSGSFGKLTQPGYVVAAVPPSTTATYVPPQTTKSSITHFDAERDEYFSPRMFALAQAAFDHNYGLDLQLQQIYGGGVGWTVLKTPKRELDLRATVQYEKQQFMTGTSSDGGTPNQNLIGSTFAANYLLHLKLFTLTQGVEFIPAYNQPSAYSASEADTFAFPAYKSLSFSMGTLDSFLNDPPEGAAPPAKRNSFQFTMGFTYAIKSKY
jgi:hypothetical protein